MSGRDISSPVILMFAEYFISAFVARLNKQLSFYTHFRSPGDVHIPPQFVQQDRTFLGNFIFVKHFFTEKISGKLLCMFCEVKPYTGHKWK